MFNVYKLNYQKLKTLEKEEDKQHCTKIKVPLQTCTKIKLKPREEDKDKQPSNLISFRKVLYLRFKMKLRKPIKLTELSLDTLVS